MSGWKSTKSGKHFRTGTKPGINSDSVHSKDYNKSNTQSASVHNRIHMSPGLEKANNMLNSLERAKQTLKQEGDISQLLPEVEERIRMAKSKVKLQEQIDYQRKNNPNHLYIKKRTFN